MFNKVDFSDLYRFLTSIGLVSIALGILLPWLYTTRGVYMSSEEYTSLTTISKNLVDKQTQLNILLINSVWWATPVLVFFGIALCLFGISKWKSKQEAIDIIDRLNLEERLDKLTPSEVEEKVQKEAKEEIAKFDEAQVSEVTDAEIQALGQKIIKIEDQFFKKILEFNPHSYEAFSNMRIDENTEADIYLRSHNQQQNLDILVEIRYLQKRLSTQVLRNAYDRLNTTYTKYFTSTKRYAYRVLIVVYNEEIAGHDEFIRFQEAVDYMMSDRGRSFKFFLMSDNEVENFDISAIGIK